VVAPPPPLYPPRLGRVSCPPRAATLIAASPLFSRREVQGAPHRPQAPQPPPRPEVARQAVQEGSPGHGAEGQPLRRGLPRQGHRPGESVGRAGGGRGGRGGLATRNGAALLSVSPLKTCFGFFRVAVPKVGGLVVCFFFPRTHVALIIFLLV